MTLNNIYNFRNPIRHFINIDDLIYPEDIETFDPINELCWTKPISFRVYKSDDRFRTLKIPNILNFIRAYYYYKDLPNFSNVNNFDRDHKRLVANLNTGDFVSGNYNKQLNDDFINLCNYDFLLKVDINEYYGHIYTHDLKVINDNTLTDQPFTALNYGATNGVIMGNYLSLYFAEYLSSLISEELQKNINNKSINCLYNYFSDDFYFFCNESDIESILNIFDLVLEKFDFVRKKKKELWTYESYNSYNILTRYWKATVRAWNLEVLKEFERCNKLGNTEIEHKYSFINQLLYRLSKIQDEKSKRGFIVNFFKTNHFQTCDYSKYKIQAYNLHQLLFLIKKAPESLLYISHIIKNTTDIKDNPKTKSFLKLRYRESLKHRLNDVQLYYYYGLKILEFNDVIEDTADLIIESQNQVLISYYLKDNLFSITHIEQLSTIDGEEYWFQNYHLILYTSELKTELDDNIKKFLLPKRLLTNKKQNKINRYISFYKNNIENNKTFINEISKVTLSITNYLNLRHHETIDDYE
ncbi:hypothetical protein [Peptostreptococcus stomatis]|uniref:hypothetical protein n=1 Tax=Peptostreptococcus stomatis TaxID=341694 RepID=UPI0024A867F8|nr:hypothetical protein [Peptostreptococcus stomatis]